MGAAFHGKRFTAWLCQERHKRRAAELRRAFTEHPDETGESYGEHLWFTVTMALRFLLTVVVMLIHGLFPFLLMRTASTQIEGIYRVMRGRVPKARREAIDADLDYSV